MNSQLASKQYFNQRGMGDTAVLVSNASLKSKHMEQTSSRAA